MKRAYYLFNPGRMSRRENTLCFAPVDETLQKRYLPVESVRALHVFGSLDTNSALYHYLGRKQVAVHFYDHYHHYTGSFSPREYLLSGRLHLAQAQAHLRAGDRMRLARAFVWGGAGNMLKTLRYYLNRGRDIGASVSRIEQLRERLGEARDIPELMGMEGNCRQAYYEAFGAMTEVFEWRGRVRRPPTDELNALISFGNSLSYTLAVDNLYHSQLDPTISFLHEPGERRFSLALDVAEIFKPILVDRLIMTLCNRRQIQARHFDRLAGGACLLCDTGRKTFAQAWEEQLERTIKHRTLNRKVSYRHLVKLECYKIAKDLLGMKPYEPFVSWW